MNQLQLLNYALGAGIIDLDTIAGRVEMEERQKYINKHRYKVWEDEKGRFSTYLPDPKGRKLVRKKTREEVEDAIVNHYKEQEKSVTFYNVFHDWLQQKLEYGEILKQTADRYTTAYLRYVDGSEIATYNFESITEEDLEIFIKKSIHDKQLTQKAWSDLRLIINGTFKFGKKKGLTSISITQFMGDLDISRKAFTPRRFTDRESVFKDQEVAAIENFINNAEPSLINYGILLAFKTGMRAGELAAVKYSDIEGSVLHIQRTEVRYKDEEGHNLHEFRDRTKGRDGYRDVILTTAALEVIENIKELNPGEYLFEKDGRFIRGKAFSTKLYKICDYLGIKRRSLHKARKTYATKLLNAGVNKRIIINQMGHTDIHTTESFYWFNNLDELQIGNQLEQALAIN